MKDLYPPFCLTMGEPAGIGGELTLAAWAARRAQNLPPFFAVDDPARLKVLDPECSLKEISDPAEALACFDHALPVYPVSLTEPVTAGHPSPQNAKAVIDSIRIATEFCLTGQASGLITNPIQKAALYEAGFSYPGHTEYIAALCGAGHVPLMMLMARDLRVVPLTIHIPLKDVPTNISKDKIIEAVLILHKSLRQDFGIERPCIAVCGLNPHAGEGGTIGREEQDIIQPALSTLKAQAIQVTGPHSADTLFHPEARKTYDAVLGMYHDQVLIPVKSLDFYGGVNVTLGLPVIRTSPDHGTALDIAGKKLARPDSLIQAIKTADQIAKARKQRL